MNLGNDIRRRATLLATARVWHDAISAELVAAFDNGNEGDIPGGARRRRHIPHFTSGAFIEINDAAFTFERPRNQLRQTIRSSRARNHRDHGAGVKDRRAFQLRHTTHHADEGLVAEAPAPDLADARKDLVRRALAN